MKKVLVIAGIDPSAGAGLLVDIKVLNHFKVHGFGVASAITFQNESEVDGLEWVSINNIERQIQSIFKLHRIDTVKIGVLENTSHLKSIVDLIKNHNSEAKIIWDPILKSSSGFIFNLDVSAQVISHILPHLYLVTPNLREFQSIWQAKSSDISQSFNTNVLVKSARESQESIIDRLFTVKQKHEFTKRKISNHEKHGSGCVLSSAIAANIAIGHDLLRSYEIANIYLNNYLLSTNSLLGVTY